MRGCGGGDIEGNLEKIYFVIINNNPDGIIVKAKRYNINVNASNGNYEQNILQIYPGQILNVASQSEACQNCSISTHNKFYIRGKSTKLYYKGGINTITLEIMDPWQTIKYAELNINFTNYGNVMQVTKNSFWDTELNFDSKVTLNYKEGPNPEVTRVYTATFSKANISLFASELRNFRIWNNSLNNIKIKVFKVAPEYSEDNFYELGLKIYFDINGDKYRKYYFNDITKGRDIPSYYENLYTHTEFENIFWQTSATWEKDIASGGVETIFHSTLAYTGPYKIEIYDKATNLKLLEDKVRYPIFDEEELLKYKDSTNPFADGMRIRTKLEWYKKSEVPSSMLNISTISGYPNEFYAEYKGY